MENLLKKTFDQFSEKEITEAFMHGRRNEDVFREMIRAIDAYIDLEGAGFEDDNPLFRTLKWQLYKEYEACKRLLMSGLEPAER